MRLVDVGHTRGAGLQVPAALARELNDAVAAGREEAAGWARIHPTGSTDRFGRDAIASVGAPPTGDAERTELAELHEYAAARTPEGTARTLELNARAGWETFEATIAQIGRTHGADQAKRAARLVEEAASRTDAVSAAAKVNHFRTRPYDVDPTLTTIVPRPIGNGSHPSGHASGAYAAAIVLAAFVPERADELMDLAAQVAFSRLYGGVHFRSDVVVGARIAARVAADVLRRDGLTTTVTAAA